jgi:hypothetical protein
MLMSADPLQFQRHEIDAFPAGYQLAVADVNGDGKPDVIALSTDADRVDWYENPSWRRRPVARTLKNIDLAPRMIGGKLSVALASGFYFNESARGGQVELLTPPAKDDELWARQPIAVDPVPHRLRWGDLDGDGRQELINAPIFGPGSKGNVAPKPAHLWAFRLPKSLAGAAGAKEGHGAGPSSGPWEVWKIDETLTVLHGLWVGDLDGDGRDEVLTASFEGIFRFDLQASGAGARWEKRHISAGAPPADKKPGSPRGSSEIMPGKFGRDRPFLAAIEPWHGNEVVVYTSNGLSPKPSAGGNVGGGWDRRVLDDTLNEGHALVVADFDGDGVDEIIAGWRAGGGGLRLYRPADAKGERCTKSDLDPGMPAEGAVAADINGDGRLDLVVVAGRANKLVWYEQVRAAK